MWFVHCYLMRDRPDEVRSAAPHHARYWKSKQLDGYRGGPFADHSGGLIIFSIDDRPSAEALVADDPFVRHDLLRSVMLKEWTPD